MDDYLVGIGKRIKEVRKGNNKTINDIAIKAEVTSGLISRIENGRTIPSLPVFIKIVSALDMEITDFFKGIPHVNGNSCLVFRKENQTIIEKEDEAEGFNYMHIFSRQITSMGFEAVLLDVLPNSKRAMVTTDAYEFKHILSGECYYIIGNEKILLKEGDSIFFDGRIPHVPENRSKQLSKMLVIYFYL